MTRQVEKETAKRQILEIQMIALLKEELVAIESQNSLDYMEIKIINHGGSIQAFSTTKKLIKAY